jgi:glucose/arabinose dehydrogenase
MKKYLLIFLCCGLFFSTPWSDSFRANASQEAFKSRQQQDEVKIKQQDVEAPQAINTLIQLEPVVTTGLTSPVYVTNAHNGSNRLYIVERAGIIKVLQPGASTPTIFLDIQTLVLSTSSERGLLGLAFHPLYATNRRFFVYYTRQTDGAIQISEFRTSSADPNVADTTEFPILTIPHPGQTNHNGGMMEFGPNDGFLYIGTGDGGSANDPPNNAQNIDSLLGKILRLDINPPVGGGPYTSPPSNPFVGVAGADEIYAYGMRNPWRFSFDRGGTRQLYVGDVGQGAREEIDIITLGGNYGWRIMEGTICNPNLNGGSCTPPAGHIPPIAEYSHSGGRCSITGGYVYRGQRGSLPTGAYVFADYCTGEIFLMQNGLNTSTLLLDTTMNISSFGEDESGEIYVVGLGGVVQRLTSSASQTIGVFQSSATTFYLRNTNTQGFADFTIQYGPAVSVPVVGDWDGNGTTTIGVYEPGTQTFYLRNSNTAGFANITFRYGPPGAIPLAGDWNGDGIDTIGVYDPNTQIFYLRNSNSAGFADLMIQYGPTGATPVVGDWNGDGTTTIGVYDPSIQAFYLRNSNTAGFADITVRYGPNGATPVVGDWDGNGSTTIGVYDPGTQIFYLRNSNTAGFADLMIRYGPPGAMPLSGNWDGL